MAEPLPPIELTQISDDLRARLAGLLGTVPIGVYLSGPPDAFTPAVAGYQAAWEVDDIIYTAFAVELPDNTILWVPGGNSAGGIGGGGLGGSAGNGGGLDVYLGESPTTYPMGALAAGTDIYGRTLVSIIEEATTSYKAPYFNSVGISGYTNNQILEVGTPFTAPKTFNWNVANFDQAVANSVSITYVNTPRTLFTGQPLSGNVTDSTGGDWSAPVSLIPKQFRFTGTDNKSKPFISDFVIRGVYPVFYGKVTSATRPVISSALVLAGNRLLVDSSGTVSIPWASGSGDYIWVAIPTTSATKSRWWQSDINNGVIGGEVFPGGNLFPSPESTVDGALNPVSVSSGTWTNIDYNVYVSNYRTAAASLELRN